MLSSVVVSIENDDKRSTQTDAFSSCKNTVDQFDLSLHPNWLPDGKATARSCINSKNHRSLKFEREAEREIVLLDLLCCSLLDSINFNHHGNKPEIWVLFAHRFMHSNDRSKRKKMLQADPKSTQFYRAIE